jgi:hypothetical protein
MEKRKKKPKLCNKTGIVSGILVGRKSERIIPTPHRNDWRYCVYLTILKLDGEKMLCYTHCSDSELESINSIPFGFFVKIHGVKVLKNICFDSLESVKTFCP